MAEYDARRASYHCYLLTSHLHSYRLDLQDNLSIFLEHSTLVEVAYLEM